MQLSFLRKILFTTFVAALFFQGCSSTPFFNVASNFQQTYKAFTSLIYGYEDYPITQDLVDQIPYASLRMKIGKGPAGLLILESLDRRKNEYTWVSADDIYITTKGGRIIRAHGLTNNLIDFFSSEPSFKEISEGKGSKDEFRYISLDNPEVYEMKLKVSYKTYDIEGIFILDQRKELLLIEERIENSYIRWKYVNKYWVDKDTGFVWQSIQEIAPNVPPILIQITKKPS